MESVQDHNFCAANEIMLTFLGTNSDGAALFFTTTVGRGTAGLIGGGE
jgi:hypothetical protein